MLMKIIIVACMGMNTYAIVAELNINGLVMNARDMSQEVIEDYLYDEYWSEALYELGYDDEDELSPEIEEEVRKTFSELSQEKAAWEIYKIPESLKDKTDDELYNLISELGIKYFIEKYKLKNI